MNSNYCLSLILCTSFAIVSIFFVSCKESKEKNNQLPEPQIKCGVARIQGKLNDRTSKITSLILKFQNPVTADESIIETTVEKDGSFYFEAPIECSNVFSSIYFPGYGVVITYLSSEDLLNISLKVDNNNKLKIDNISGNNFLTNQDKENIVNVGSKYLTYRDIDADLICKMTPEEYANHEMNKMKTRIDYSLNGTKFSEAGENFILNELQLMHLTGILFPYKERVELLCRDKIKGPVQEPTDIQYYSFLKSFKLNNQRYIYSNYYSKMIQILLSRKAFNIPHISNKNRRMVIYCKSNVK